MISVEGYLKATDTFKDTKRGGQELLLGEIVGAFVAKGCKRVCLPYPTTSLTVALAKCGISIVCVSESFDGLYFGTPTIVNDKPLFPESLLSPQIWNKLYEREITRMLCSNICYDRQCKIIVSGLGSGDISVEERIEDMGEGAKVIAFKMFEDFSDWVIAREIK